jgi:hypothetical protein
MSKNKTKNKKEKNKARDDDFEADLQGICPEYRALAKKRLREGKPINPLWDCYERYVTRLFIEKGFENDYY